jgi:hypothetical protein
MRNDENNTHPNDAVYMDSFYVPDVFPEAICCHEELEDAHWESSHKRSDGKKVIECEFTPCDENPYTDSKQGGTPRDTSHNRCDVGEISNWMFAHSLRNILRRFSYKQTTRERGLETHTTPR